LSTVASAPITTEVSPALIDVVTSTVSRSYPAIESGSPEKRGTSWLPEYGVPMNVREELKKSSMGLLAFDAAVLAIKRLSPDSAPDCPMSPSYMKAIIFAS